MAGPGTSLELDRVKWAAGLLAFNDRSSGWLRHSLYLVVGSGSDQGRDMRIWKDLDFSNIWICYSCSRSVGAENSGRSGACDRI